MIGRMAATARAALTAWRTYGSTIHEPVPTDALSWDDLSARYARYVLYEHYYNNTIYFDPVLVKRIQLYKPALYKHIRGVYNPVNRLVRLYVSKVYGGALDIENLRDGAIPVEQADDTLRAALRQIWMWSNWAQAKSVYVRHGAMLGDTCIKVVDDVGSQKVRLEVLDPRKLIDVKIDAVGNVKYVQIEYQRLDEETGKQYTYGEVIDQAEFITTRDGDEYAYFEDGYGRRVSRWPNEYGFVPVVLGQHAVTGAKFGENAFQAVLTKINEVNDQASLLNDQIRKTVNPVWFVSGVSGGELNVDGANREAIPTIEAPEGAAANAMVYPLDIANTSANTRELLAELENDLPELSLHRLRNQTQVTAPGVRTAYSDAIDRIDEARGNYDAALVRAQQMAVSIGALRRYDDFRAYTLDSYHAGKLDHFIANRPVIEDSLSKQERMQILQGADVSKRLLLEELDYPEDVIEREVAAEMDKAAAEARAFTDSLFGGQDGGEEDTTPEPAGTGSSSGETGDIENITGG